MFDSRLFSSFQASPAGSRSSFKFTKRIFAFALCTALLWGALCGLTRVLGFDQAPLQLNGFVQQARLIANDGEGSDQLGRSVAISGDTVVAGAPGDNIGANANQGSAYVFRRSGATWAQEAQLLAPDGLGGDSFGQSVAIDGDVIAVGAAFDDKPAGSNAGSVYVFRRTGTVWAFEQKLVPNDPQANDRFGNAVSLVGDLVLVGASLKDIGANADQGAAYVFKRAAGTWTQQTRLTATNGVVSDGVALDEFGYGVALNGNTALIGVPGRASGKGVAYVFTTDGTTWMFQQQFTNNTLAANDRFGNAVALNADTALIGAPNALAAHQGAGFVFTRSGTTWAEQAQLIANDGAADDGFASSVALIGETALLGAPFDNLGFSEEINDQGSAYEFVRAGTNWFQQTKLKANDGAADDQTGIAVALSAQYAVVGSWLKDINASLDQGAAYVFLASCPNLTITPATLPAGAPNVAYSQTLTASGGVAPYSFALDSGALPVGLSLSAAGVLSGTTAEQGNFTFAVKATDANGCFNTRPYTLAIGACPTITFNPQILAPAPVGQTYIHSILADGGAAPYNFSVSAGSLPPGIALSSGGVLNGTPTTLGSFGFTLKATDSNGCSGTRSYTLTITCQLITLNPEALPQASVGQSYSQTFTASGGNAPYTFSQNGGTLPTGLTLTPAGVLSGTPSAVGNFTFAVKVTDAGGCMVTHSYAVAACAPITVNPATLPAGRPGQLYPALTFTGTGGIDPYTFVLTGTLPTGLSFNAGVLSGTPTQPGGFPLTVTATDGNGCVGSRSYTLLVNSRAVQGDYDGDGKTDLTVWRGPVGTWLTIRSGNGTLSSINWGTSNAPFNDVPVPGDYDGDGKVDVAVFRRSDGVWYIVKSGSAQILTQAWGVGTDIPVPGDYDGDGKTDLAVWRPSDGNWYILKSSDGQFIVQSWGSPNAPFNDVAVPADYDGDGKTDIAIFRRQTGVWFVRKSSDGQALIQAWGVGTDVPVPGDYDGDGKADFAVWRPGDGNWYVLKSSNGQFQVTQWGSAALGDIPVPGDYDGDGKTDIAVWRPGNGTWYVIRSTNGAFLIQAHGQAGDTPVVK
ncbi:MAG: VCBS repeat-containing protein [Acidobacteria bacterium]|nr:VCBS repeat-containing protein [Acidobacteriota bacterium]MBI3428213.1 VCBS repeat-containing protein [Acidobacteriota bacterium]